MSPLVFDLLGNLPQLAVVYVQTRLLPMRRPGLFAALAMAVAFTAMLLKRSVAWAGTPLNMFLVLLDFAVLPLLFYRHDIPLVQRVTACALSMTLMWLGEMTGALLCVFTGGIYANYELERDRPVLAVAIHVLFVVVVLAAGRLLEPVMRRWSERHMQDDGSGGPKLPAESALFSALPAVSALLLWVLLLVTVSASDEGDQAVALTAGALLLAMGVAVDVAVLTSAGRHRRALAEQARTAELEARLAGQLEAYAQLSDQVEQTARLRHDMRNHLQVLSSLAERGEKEPARSYAAAMLETLRSEEAAAPSSANGTTEDGGAR